MNVYKVKNGDGIESSSIIHGKEKLSDIIIRFIEVKILLKCFMMEH